MKLDIVRAWKDESYRHGLSAEQLHTLPANPVGELTDADLATISGAGGGFPPGGFGPGSGGPSGGPGGGFGNGGGILPPPVGGGVVGSTTQTRLLQARENFESLAQTCENNCFTCNWISASNFSIYNTLSPATQICANTH